MNNLNNLNTISKYLTNTFPNMRIKIQKDLVKLDDHYRSNYETPLFQLYLGINYLYFYYNEKDFPILYLKSFVEKTYNYFKYTEVEEDEKIKIIFETNGDIPYRWFTIIKDFVDETIEFEILENIQNNEKVEKEKNYLQLLEKIPTPTLEKIILESHKNVQYEFTVQNKEWYTKDGIFSEYAKKILTNKQKFDSLKQTKYPNLHFYKVLYAAEGGIEIFNDYLEDWISFSHMNLNNGSIRNECKGHNNYRTNKDIKPEELMVLYLYLNKFKCSLSEFKRN